MDNIEDPLRAASSQAARQGAVPDVSARVRFDQIESHFRLTPQPVMAGMLFTVLLAWAVLPSAGANLTLGWLAAKWLIGGMRLLEHHLFAHDAHREQHAERWYWRYYVLMLLDSVSWGLIPMFFISTGDFALDTVLLASVFGLAAAGVFTLIGNVFSTTTFLVIVLLPTLYYFSTGSDRSAWLGSLGVLVFLAIVVFESWRGAQLFLEITRLRRQNEWIAEERRHALVLAEQGSAAKTRFLATVSHELRTPLNGILGMAQLLQQSTLEPTQRLQLDVVAQSARHLRTIIDEILDMARIESGRVSVTTAPFALGQTVRDVTDMLTPVAKDKGLAFSYTLDEALATHWLGDAARIRQVLHNLLGNAIKFTARGSVSLAASAGSDGLRFVVSDTGLGVSPDALARIFEPFEQSACGAEQVPAGTGLGLTIARQLARAMGGDVICANSSAAGTSFVFDVACSVVATPRVGIPGGLPTALRPLHADGTVLVVEDNAVNAMVAGAMLERLGLSFEHVDSGEKALRRLNDARYALILMDCQMPGIDGLETTRRWRALEVAEPERGRTPVVAVTANAANNDRERCLAAGMDDYLAKPYELAALRDKLAKQLAVANASR